MCLWHCHPLSAPPRSDIVDVKPLVKLKEIVSHGLMKCRSNFTQGVSSQQIRESSRSVVWNNVYMEAVER
jgi:hypothetical protein